MTWHPFALANKTILGLSLFGGSKQHACKTHMWPTAPPQPCWSPWELLCFTTIDERLVEGQHTDEKNRVSVELNIYWLWVLRYSSKTWNAKKNSVEQFSKITTKKKKKVQLETTFVSCREAITNECITPSRLPRRYCPLQNHFIFHAISLRRCYLSVSWSASILIKTGESSEVKISQGDNIGWDCQLSRLIELLYLTQRFYIAQFLWKKFTQWSRNRGRYCITSFLLS